MFESVIEKFDEYWNKVDAENPANFNQDLASEVRKRLEQLAYLYKLFDAKRFLRYQNIFPETFDCLVKLKFRASIIRFG